MKKDNGKIENGIVCLEELEKKILDNKIVLKIPELQREYVWGPKEWEQLWNNIMTTYRRCEEDENSQHNMGILTLKQDINKNCYYVLDGQQRLTTIYTLIMYLEQRIKPEVKIENFFENRSFFEIESIKNFITTEPKGKTGFEILYRFFIMKHVECGEEEVTPLLNVIKKRLFWMVKIIGNEQNEHIVFENINATGKELQYADLLLNYLLGLPDVENNQEKIKEEWEKFIKEIDSSKLLDEDIKTILEPTTFDDYQNETRVEMTEDESEEQQSSKHKPLKLKKFLNAMHGLKVPQPCSISENVESFENIFKRLNEEGWTPNAEDIIKQLNEWKEYYLAIVNPTSQKNIVNNIENFEEELYLLSILGYTNYLPMLMRVLKKYHDKKYNEKRVKAIFGAVVRYSLYIEIYEDRKNSEIQFANQKIILLDYIIDAFPDEKIKFEILYEVLALITIGKDDNIELFKGFFNMLPITDANNIIDEKIKDEKIRAEKIREKKIKQLQYHSKISKALLVIDYNASNKENKEKIHNKEKNMIEEGKGAFQVEHIVAQNVTDSRENEIIYKNYGFNVETVGTLYNLILLESTLNNKANNTIPEEKIELWKKSTLFSYYKEFLEIPKEKATYREKQGKRIKQLTKNIIQYIFGEVLNELKVIGREEGREEIKDRVVVIRQQNYKFLYTQRKLGQVIRCMPLGDDVKMKIPNPDNDNILYSYNKIITFEPEILRKKDVGIRIYWKNNQGKIEYEENCQFKNCLKKFLECWSAKEPNIYDCLQKWEKDVIEGIKIKKQDYNYNKYYPMKMIHTNYISFDNIEKIFKNISIDDEKKFFAPRKRYDEDINPQFFDKNIKELQINKSGVKSNAKEDYIEIIGDYNFETLVSGLQSLYNKIKEDCNINFSFWIEVTNNHTYFIAVNKDGKELHIPVMVPYCNIGDEETFHDYIGKDISEKVQNSEKDVQITKKQEKEEKDITRYFTYEQWTLKDVLEKNWNIPYYQREYVWDETNWEDLWNSLFLDEKNIELGTIIVKENDGQYDLVDGQQRISTLITLNYVLNASSNKKSKLYRENAGEYFDNKKKAVCNWEMLKSKVSFDVLVIIKDAPLIYQYEVFSSINGTGKKLSIEDKIKNFMLDVFKNKYKEKIIGIAKENGFAKAFVEKTEKKHIPEQQVYRQFKTIVKKELEDKEDKEDKKVIEYLTEQKDYYRFIKGRQCKKIENELFQLQDFEVQLKLFQMLNVDTADALMLDAIIKYKEEENFDIVKFVKGINVLYFLLYIADRSGNAKKTINERLPKLVEREDEGIDIVKHELLTDTDLRFFREKTIDEIAEKIWTEFVCTLDIYNCRKNVSRFILLMIEQWLGLDSEILLKKIKEQEKLDIEHICPIDDSKLNWNGSSKPDFMNRLENICILESNINRSVSNKPMTCNNDDGKLVHYDKKKGCCCIRDAHQGEQTKTYLDSKFKMPKLFYIDKKDINKKDINYDYVKQANGVYGSEQAKNRMKDIQKEILGENGEVTPYKQALIDILPSNSK